MSKTPAKAPAAALIAQVATAVIVNGERVIVQPGEPLPPLDEADEADLVDLKAARASTKSTPDQSAT